MSTYHISTQKLEEKNTQDRINSTDDQKVNTPHTSIPDRITEYPPPPPKYQQEIRTHQPLGPTCATYKDSTHQKPVQRRDGHSTRTSIGTTKHSGSTLDIGRCPQFTRPPYSEIWWKFTYSVNFKQSHTKKPDIRLSTIIHPHACSMPGIPTPQVILHLHCGLRHDIGHIQQVQTPILLNPRALPSTTIYPLGYPLVHYPFQPDIYNSKARFGVQNCIYPMRPTCEIWRKIWYQSSRPHSLIHCI